MTDSHTTARFVLAVCTVLLVPVTSLVPRAEIALPVTVMGAVIGATIWVPPRSESLPLVVASAAGA